jgi:hypothetical protein
MGGVMVIGFRTYTNGFSYVILDGTQQEPELITKDRLKYPKGASISESMSWLRRQVVEILDAYSDIDGVCIKTIEPAARKKSKERYQAEGVILEAIRTILDIDCATRINSQLKRDIINFDEPARYIDKVLSGSKQLEELSHINFQEAALAAISELPAEE